MNNLSIGPCRSTVAEHKTSWEKQQVQLERHRARRYLFQANIELTDVQSETQISGRTTYLSLFGCYVNTLIPLTPGTKIRIKIAHRSVNFRALGRVVYAQSRIMGKFSTHTHECPRCRAKWECGNVNYQDECPYPIKTLCTKCWAKDTPPKER